MKILAIETSCDETAAAVVSKNPKENHVKVLSNVVASSLILHAKTGGIIPDVAAREQLKFIIPVTERAIEDCKLKIETLDAIAVTYGPGLIGSLLIGVETAKTLAYLWKKPIIPVNHLLGHIYANWLITPNEKQLTTNKKLEVSSQKLEVEFPAIALLVSGGHTDLLLVKNHNDFKWLGGTRDDAAGEAFDKIGRLLNLPYPAGPTIEKLSEGGDVSRFTFPRPMIGSKDFDFSFSGLKAAVWRETKITKQFDDKTIADICASVQKSIVEVLVRKTVKAARKYNVKSILLGGGVTANQKLRESLELEARRYTLNAKIFCPQKIFCTDNAAMIGAYACFHPKKTDWKKLTANPELYFS
ncbi:MAG: tRNA (adenosine(37)-N6)-threonylcarbamoyltransferase complex transferase subunit TsaD [Candidatus Levybacteria bacterium]|nr:tRNA (adenosine(37)-N6)-threonylcarbamoyltransferase complex transferase subunit TsaD [Candidatus Levybacteria bacterium]